MSKKNLTIQVQLMACIIVTVVLSADVFYTYHIRKKDWGTQLRTTFLTAVEKSLEARGKKDFYVVSEHLGNYNYKEDSLMRVTVNSGNGDKDYYVPLFKHYNNIADNPSERLVDSAILEDYPLNNDSLNQVWDSLLYLKSISGKASIRVSVTDLSGNVSTVYSKRSPSLPALDSLFSCYIGYRCEVEVTAFASFSYLDALSMLDLLELCILMMIIVLLFWRIYAYKTLYTDKNALLESSVTNTAISVITHNEKRDDVYALGNDIFFDASDRSLRKGSQIIKLLPQVTTLLVGFMKADNNRMSIPEICFLLWPDGSGTSERVHKVVARLRTSISDFSSYITIVSGNYQYQLKITHFIDKNTNSEAV